MKVKGLDGREYRLKLTGHVVTGLGGRSSSENHKEARRLLKSIFPFDAVYEEILLPGCGTELYLDFLLASRGLAVEVQGRQHREYVRHFHKGKTGFASSQTRDGLKRRFCDLNGLTLLELHDDDRDGWRDTISRAFMDGSSTEQHGDMGTEDRDDSLPD